MSVLGQLNVGIVGACGRGKSFKAACDALDAVRIHAVCDAITGKRPCPVGIHEAMAMTLPGLVSQQSIQQGGAWLPVPDSREW
jgi:hypothetical protein